VAQECTLDLVGLKRGSTTLDFVPASGQQSLLPTSIEAVSGVGAALKFVARRRGNAPAPDIGVLDSLNNLGEVFDNGVEKLKWIVPARNGSRRIVAEFVPDIRPKIQSHMQKPLPLGGGASAPDVLEGMLELSDGKCRIINPLGGAPSILNFGEDKAENVFEARHKPVKVEVDAKTRKVKTIEITATPEVFGRSHFFEGKTIDQLISEQNVQPIDDLSALSAGLSDDDVESLIAEIHRGREA
jgi:hypothetical protein